MTKTMLAVLATAFALSTLVIVPVKASTDGISTVSISGEFDKRRKPRVPGGSGCDDPRDVIEHPECTP